MGKPKRYVTQYNVRRMTDDMSERGWIAKDLARIANLSEMTVSRFLRAERQNPRTAKALSAALGYSTRRYLVREPAVA